MQGLAPNFLLFVSLCQNILGANDARYKRYSALDDDGICRVGEKLNDQCIMINREVPVDDRDLTYATAFHKRGIWNY